MSVLAANCDVFKLMFHMVELSTVVLDSSRQCCSLHMGFQSGPVGAHLVGSCLRAHKSFIPGGSLETGVLSSLAPGSSSLGFSVISF